MDKAKINSLQEYIDFIETNDIVGYEIELFRGQSENWPLLPSIARKNSSTDTTNVEIQMLEDLKRRSFLLLNRTFKNDWEWLVLAQHFGLNTRLLDWTSNPLTALWYACSDETKITQNSFVYILYADTKLLVDITKDDSPFQSANTRILRPTLNNERIVAQSGWFTAHKYSDKFKCFIKLESNSKTKHLLTEIEIPAKIKRGLLNKLSKFGINNRTLYPDVSGLCSHLNWKYTEKI